MRRSPPTLTNASGRFDCLTGIKSRIHNPKQVNKIGKIVCMPLYVLDELTITIMNDILPYCIFNLYVCVEVQLF